MKTDEGHLNTPIILDPGVIDGIVDGDPVPSISMATLIQEEGIPFSMKYLCLPNRIKKSKPDFKKIVGLGILCVDLIYLNLYEKQSFMMDYIDASQVLVEDIHATQFFDFKKMKHFATKKEHLDSLMYLSLHNFGKMEDYWREHDKTNLSYTFASSVWLEDLYLASQVVKQKRNKKIEERIAEQKTILKDLIDALERFKNDPNMVKLTAGFKIIDKSFEGIEISYNFDEPTKEKVNKRIVIKENTETTVKMTKKQLNAVIKATEEVRNQWIGN